MTVDETNFLIDKAKGKKDGVYSFRGNLWVVKNNRFVVFSDYAGNCFQRAGIFYVQIGKVERYDRRKELTKLLKRLTT